MTIILVVLVYVQHTKKSRKSETMRAGHHFRLFVGYRELLLICVGSNAARNTNVSQKETIHLSPCIRAIAKLNSTLLDLILDI